MDINQELARIFAGAVPKLTNTEVKWVLQHEKTHDEIAAHREDELRSLLNKLYAARVAVLKVYADADKFNLPIVQMMACAEDCLTESIQEIYKKLGR
jgi:hypothetical protein